MTPKEIDRELDTFCARMSEHVDSIRVIATAPQDGGTGYHSRGRGNWYAQIGSAEEFLQSNDNSDLACRITEAITEIEE